MPKLTRAIVEMTLTGLVTLSASLAPGLAPSPTFGPTLGPSKKPLKTAPRQIAVRLNNARQGYSGAVTKYGNLRSDTGRLEHINLLSSIPSLEVFVEVRTRTETSNKYDSLCTISFTFYFHHCAVFTVTDSRFSLILLICPSIRLSIPLKGTVKAF